MILRQARISAKTKCGVDWPTCAYRQVMESLNATWWMSHRSRSELALRHSFAVLLVLFRPYHTIFSASAAYIRPNTLFSTSVLASLLLLNPLYYPCLWMLTHIGFVVQTRSHAVSFPRSKPCGDLSIQLQAGPVRLRTFAELQ